jgi:phosphoglucomutase
MAIIHDSRTGLPIGDPARVPFLEEYRFSRASIDLSPFILSVSGWRKVFAADGDEESETPGISLDDMERIVLIGNVLSRFFLSKTPGRPSRIAVGIDSRPTGPAIADLLIRTFLVNGLEIRYPFITAAPEIMAWTRLDDTLDGFAYVSASHNPIGHNGLKFGLSSGGVIGGNEATELIRTLKDEASGADGMLAVAESIERIQRLSPAKTERVYQAAGADKTDALSAYDRFCREVITGLEDGSERDRMIAGISERFRESGAGIAADLNGSARTVSIDREFIAGFGVKLEVLNGEPRRIAHRIVPEGESLEACARFLEELHRKDPAFAFGYVPDNDGDRGNLVYVRSDGKAVPIEAQEVFALACLAELSWLVYTGKLHYDEHGKAEEKLAVAVNGPTSLRIERIAQAFDARVFRAEVGEANVVTLASNLRKRGYIVRILGEGSNGGNITHPSSVRDPLSTVFSVLKLLTVRTNGDRKGLFRIWCDRSGRPELYRERFTLQDVLESLPRFVTTSAFEDRAKLRIRNTDHGRLKMRYERLFLTEWDERKAEISKRFGIHFWEEVVYDGPEETRGTGLVTNGKGGNGGIKILFKNHEGTPVGFIWMRGSGTEPVFRILADIEGSDPEAEAYFLEWHRSMIERADAEE